MPQNKQKLHDLINRAERGVLLPAEAQILRDFVESYDEVCMCLDELNIDQYVHKGYDASDTSTFRVPASYDGLDDDGRDHCWDPA